MIGGGEGDTEGPTVSESSHAGSGNSALESGEDDAGMDATVDVKTGAAAADMEAGAAAADMEAGAAAADMDEGVAAADGHARFVTAGGTPGSQKPRAFIRWSRHEETGGIQNGDEITGATAPMRRCAMETSDERTDGARICEGSKRLGETEAGTAAEEAGAASEERQTEARL
jgi:hypothetical protein